MQANKQKIIQDYPYPKCIRLSDCPIRIAILNPWCILKDELLYKFQSQSRNTKLYDYQNVDFYFSKAIHQCYE